MRCNCLNVDQYWDVASSQRTSAALETLMTIAFPGRRESDLCEIRYVKSLAISFLPDHHLLLVSIGILISF